MDNVKNKQLPKLLTILLLIIVVIILSLRSCAPERATVLVPDYAPVEIDENAVPMAGGAEEEEPPVVVTGGGSVTLSFTDDVSYSISQKKVTLFYQNPPSSTHNLVVQIIVQSSGGEYLIAQSGLLARGYEVTTLDADADVPMLQPGGYTGVMRLLFYDITTNEKAMVDTDIPCTIQVVD